MLLLMTILMPLLGILILITQIDPYKIKITSLATTTITFILSAFLYIFLNHIV